MGAHERSTESTLRVIMFSSMQYDVSAFEKELSDGPNLSAILDIVFVSSPLDDSTVSLTKDASAVCIFATDIIDAHMLQKLYDYGIRLITLRYAGCSNVDIERANQLGIFISRVPAHAPSSIAEYTVALMLALNRKTHIAHSRVRDGNLSLHGLVGFDVSDCTIGIIGTGKVGRIVARIMKGFGSQLLAYDIIENQQIIDLGAKYVSMRKLLANSDILCLHAPLVPGTYHMIGADTLARCKRGVHIINTSRGGLIDIPAVIEGLHTGQIGGLAMDVYEGENSIFFKDQVNELVDRNFLLLKSLPNVLITGHQSALTSNALATVAKCTIKTLVQFQRRERLDYVVKFDADRKIKSDATSSSSASYSHNHGNSNSNNNNHYYYNDNNTNSNSRRNNNNLSTTR